MVGTVMGDDTVMDRMMVQHGDDTTGDGSTGDGTTGGGDTGMER